MPRIARMFLVIAAIATVPLRAQSPRPGWVPTPLPPAADRVVICVDVSNSMRTAGFVLISPAIRSAFLDGSGKDLPFDVGIMKFGAGSMMLLNFSHRQADVDAALQQLTKTAPDAAQSQLYDAVAQAASILRAAGPGGKRVVVFSHGGEEGSTVSIERLYEIVRAAPGVTVDVIRVGGGGRVSPGLRVAISTLARLAVASGGKFIEALQDSQLDAAVSTVLQAHPGTGNAQPVLPAAPAPAGVVTPPTASGPALHTVKVGVHATTEPKCLQLAYGVAFTSLQDVSATTALVSGRDGSVNLSINCIAVGAGQPAIALVTAAGGSAQAAAKVGESIAAQLAAASN